jgi:hypothetical protein
LNATRLHLKHFKRLEIALPSNKTVGKQADSRRPENVIARIAIQINNAKFMASIGSVFN